MSLFHENIKQLLAEVEKFLTESLKKEKLGKKATEHKALILEKLNNFLEENPSMRLVLSQDTISVSDDSTMTGGSSKSDESGEDNYIDSGLSMVGVADLDDPVFAAYLEKKQKKGSGLFGSSKFQSRWCVIHRGCFYYFAKPDDKKQHGSFRMEGYRFRMAPDMSTKKKEKELCFEIYHPDEKKRAYQFMAKNKEDLEQWQTFVESGGHQLIEEDLYEELENTAPSSQPPKPAPETVTTIKVEDASPDDSEVYEDPDSPLPPPPPTTTPHMPPPPITSLPPTSKNLPPPPPPPITRSPVTPPKSPHLPELPQIPDEGEELYEDAFSPIQEPNSTPPVPGRHLPPPPEVSPTPPPTIPFRPKRDLPPTPTPKKRVKVNITCKPEEDFENKFYGKWDCTGDDPSELSFKRGDVIHVLNREFDEKSWWIGELNGKFGLVPKTFLVPAYTLITQ